MSETTHGHTPPAAAADPAAAASDASVLTAEVVALLRRHSLLQPLLKGLVEAELAAESPLEPEEREQLLVQWASEQGVESAMAEARQRLGLEPADVGWLVERPERLTRVAKARYAAKAEARFLQRKAGLDLVTYSLVRLSDGNLARELFLRLQDGEASFAELAERYSDGPERQTRGVIGPKPLSDAHPQLAECLRTARDGEVIPPFRVADWWLIVRREQLQSAVLDEAMAERMAQELLQEWILEETQRRLQQVVEQLHP